MSILKDSDGKYYLIDSVGSYQMKIMGGFETLKEAQDALLLLSPFTV